MAIPKHNRRGLSSIRTHTSRAEGAEQPHLAFLRIGALEMERKRRLTERDAAMARIEMIDERLGEIDEEKARLLEACGEQGRLPPVSRNAPRSRSELGFAASTEEADRGERSAESVHSGTFRIRY